MSYLLKTRKHLDQGNTAYAKSTAIKSSIYKLALVADMIKGLKASEALLQLQFCNKKVSNDLYQVLQSAIANAENNFGLDVDTLYVSEILVGKAFALKRFRPRARGRAGKLVKPFIKVSVFVTARN